MKIGMGGGCHWCTEAVFQALEGVLEVEQGYISTFEAPDKFYEGILLQYNPEEINLEELILVHLRTHQSLKDHSMRDKYKSAIYTNKSNIPVVSKALTEIKKNTGLHFVTTVEEFGNFKQSRPEIRNYYRTDSKRPFCTKFIEPKLQLLLKEFRHLL